MVQKDMPRKLTIPNFFVVGAPKCGTTALSHYLRLHPQVYFCDPKEPYYFCDDFSQIRKLHGVVDWSRYLSLFRHSKECHLAVGEGSTLYLASEIAIENILSRIPDAKMIAFVRDPVSLVASFHRHLLKVGEENQLDLKVAWQMQDNRRRGTCLPYGNSAPELLQYRKIASVGTQLSRFCERVAPEQRLVIRYEKFQVDPLSVYHLVQDFLGLEFDGRSSFERINEAGSSRSQLLVKFFRSRAGRNLVDMGKKVIPDRYRLSAAAVKERLLFTNKVNAVADEDTLELIAADLSEELDILTNVLGRV